MSACTAGGHLKFETALFLDRAFGHGDLVTIRVAGEDERQCPRWTAPPGIPYTDGG